MVKKRVLSAGQCAADHQGISRTLQQHFEAEVHAVDTHAEAMERLREGGFDLVLVNRIFDADGASGLALIKMIKADEAVGHVPVMLVSNYDDSQLDAIGVGAEPGFGKAALGQPPMLARLDKYLKATV